MNKELSISINGHTAWVMLPNRTLWLPEYNTLVISDVHIGKVQHFRKHGIPIPGKLAISNIELLKAAILDRAALRVIFLGDLFHSAYNSEWVLFTDMIRWVRQQQPCDFILTEGNHDILPKKIFQDEGIDCVPYFSLNGILFQHEPPEEKIAEITVCGHLHPGVLIKGKGKSKIKLPCFGLNEGIFYLPAFGNTTGSLSMDWPESAKTWAVIDNHTIVEVTKEFR